MYNLNITEWTDKAFKIQIIDGVIRVSSAKKIFKRGSITICSFLQKACAIYFYFLDSMSIVHRLTSFIHHILSLKNFDSSCDFISTIRGYIEVSTCRDQFTFASLELIL